MFSAFIEIVGLFTIVEPKISGLEVQRYVKVDPSGSYDAEPSRIYPVVV